jgi:hypothetical protein
VKATCKSGRIRWFKSINDNLKLQPKQFWKYVAKFHFYSAWGWWYSFVRTLQSCWCFAKHF